jgi:hypothetical protein
MAHTTKKRPQSLSFATALHVVSLVHQVAHMPRQTFCHPNIRHHCPAVEICCIGYPRVVAVDSNTACQCMHRHNVYGYIMTTFTVSTYLVRIVSQWDSVKKLLFQNEIAGRK